MSMSKLTLSMVDTVVAADTLHMLSDEALADAGWSALFAREPDHMGDEPHLLVAVDRCGLSDERLSEIETAVLGERQRRLLAVA